MREKCQSGLRTQGRDAKGDERTRVEIAVAAASASELHTLSPDSQPSQLFTITYPEETPHDL